MAGNVPLMAIYRRMFAAWMGEPAASSLRGLNFALADLKRLGLSVGARYTAQYPAEFGTIRGTPVAFRCVRAQGALAAGDIVKSYAGAAGRTGVVQATFSKHQITTVKTLAAEDVVGGLVELTSGTGANQQPRAILKSDGVANASTFVTAKRDSQLRLDPDSVPDAWGTTPDGTTNFGIFCDWEVVQAGAAVTDLVCGISLGAVTSGNYTIIVEGGYVPATVDGSQAGQGGTSGCLLYPGAAGTLWPNTAAGITAAQAAYACGRLIHAYTGAAALRLIQLYGRFRA